MPFDFLKQLIIDKFHLFQQKRSSREDQEILVQVYEASLMRMSDVYEEQLPPEQKEKFHTQLEQIVQNSQEQDFLKLFETYLDHIGGIETLKNDLTIFIDEIVEESTKISNI